MCKQAIDLGLFQIESTRDTVRITHKRPVNANHVCGTARKQAFCLLNCTDTASQDNRDLDSFFDWVGQLGKIVGSCAEWVAKTTDTT